AGGGERPAIYGRPRRAARQRIHFFGRDCARENEQGGRERSRLRRPPDRNDFVPLPEAVSHGMDGAFALCHPFGKAALWLGNPGQSCLFASPPRDGFALSRMKGVSIRAETFAVAPEAVTRTDGNVCL